MFKCLTVILMAMLAILPTVAHAQEQAPTEETLLLNYIPNIQYAPFYVALAQDLFVQNGVSIAYDYLDEPLVVDLVANGTHAFGMVSGEQVIIAREQQRPVTFIYAWYQQYPVGVVYNSATPVASAAALDSVRLGLPGRFGANYIALNALLNSAGLREEALNLQEIGYNAPEVFCVGGVDAAVVYVNNEPLQIQERIARGDCGDVTEIGVLPVADVAQLVSNGIITNEQTLAERPEIAAAVVAAFDEAVQLTLENPARAYLISLDYVEGLPASDALVDALTGFADARDTLLAAGADADALAEDTAQMRAALADEFDSAELVQLDVLLATLPLWETETRGMSQEAAWQTMAETLVSMGYIGATPDLSAAFTNDYLPAQ